jgi:hypothetical protein
VLAYVCGRTESKTARECRAVVSLWVALLGKRFLDTCLLADPVSCMPGLDAVVYGESNPGDWALPDVMIAFPSLLEVTTIGLEELFQRGRKVPHLLAMAIGDRIKSAHDSERKLISIGVTVGIQEFWNHGLELLNEFGNRGGFRDQSYDVITRSHENASLFVPLRLNN